MTDIEVLLDDLGLKQWKMHSEHACGSVMRMGRMGSVYFHEDEIIVWAYEDFGVRGAKPIAQKYGLWSDSDCVVVGWADFERVVKMMKEMDSL